MSYEGGGTRDPDSSARPQPAWNVRKHFDTFSGRSHRKSPISLDAVERRSPDSWRSALLPPWYRDRGRVRGTRGRSGSSNREGTEELFPGLATQKTNRAPARLVNHYRTATYEETQPFLREPLWIRLSAPPQPACREPRMQPQALPQRLRFPPLRSLPPCSRFPSR